MASVPTDLSYVLNLGCFDLPVERTRSAFCRFWNAKRFNTAASFPNNGPLYRIRRFRSYFTIHDREICDFLIALWSWLHKYGPEASLYFRSEHCSLIPHWFCKFSFVFSLRGRLNYTLTAFCEWKWLHKMYSCGNVYIVNTKIRPITPTVQTITLQLEHKTQSCLENGLLYICSIWTFRLRENTLFVNVLSKKQTLLYFAFSY